MKYNFLITRMAIIEKKFFCTISIGEGNSLAVQWLRLHTSNTEGIGLIPGQGTKTPHSTCCKGWPKKERETLVILAEVFIIVFSEKRSGKETTHKQLLIFFMPYFLMLKENLGLT